MPAVRAITVTRYASNGSASTDELIDPTWPDVERNVRAMDPFGQPIVFLQQRADDTESDCMGITGGGQAFHVHASRGGDWLQAVNTERGIEEIAVWTSDQGFVTKARFTWSLESTLRLARVYFDEASLDPSVPWE